MGRQEIDVRKTIAAPPSTVYALLRDGAGWPDWSPLGSFELERPGTTEREGLGAVRVFHTGRVHSREEIVELVPDRRFSYRLLSGLAIRDYRADVDLESDADGTRLRWHSTFKPKVPGTGWLYRRQLGGFIRKLVDGLAEHAAQTAPASGQTALTGMPASAR